MTRPKPPEPSPADSIDPSRIRDALAAISTSGRLGQSLRRMRLLEYLVDHERRGEGRRIKAFNIAVDVFDRDESFDPNTDSIVRTEIARLRDALELFYSEADDPELVVIGIPKGTYRPTFTVPAGTIFTRRFGPVRWRLGLAVLMIAVLAYAGGAFLSQDRQVTDTQPNSGPVDVVRIAVLPFESLGDHPELDEISFGLYSELSMDLSAYPWIAVVSAQSAQDRNADYLLRNDLLWQNNRLLSNAQLLSLPDERLVWSKSFSAATTLLDVEQTQNSITSGIVTSLGSEKGISPDLVRVRNARNSQSDLDAFLCFLSTYKYVETPTTEEHLDLRSCLEDVVQEFPDYGEAWGSLGIIYMDEARFGRNPRPRSDPWADARAAIERGLQLAPLRNPTLQAGFVMAIEAPKRDLDAAARHGRKLVELFPRHPMTLALIGSRMAHFLGRWEEGLGLVRHAQVLEPAPPSVFYLTEAYFAAIGSDERAALDTAARLTTQTSAPELLVNYLAVARVPRLEQMQYYRDLLSDQGFDSETDLVRFVSGRRYHPSLEGPLLAQLQSAFQIPVQETP